MDNDLNKQAPNFLMALYRTTIECQGLHCDTHQLDAVVAFERLLNELSEMPKRRGWFGRRTNKPIRGVYLWGGVGRGKTWLMDLFYDAYPAAEKSRFHFHRFMQDVHGQLAVIKGRADPLKRVARDFADNNRLLCLDEFTVIDIGDAVILAGLLKALFDEGVTLVTTSNQVPEDLYKNGIQRVTFLPAIDLLKRHTQVVNLGGERDYRSDELERSGVYHFPLNADVRERIADEFQRLAGGKVLERQSMSILGREIPYVKQQEGLVWFDFNVLCGPPRSQNDYIEVARRHQTVFISDIPRLDGSGDDRMRRFIFLIDEFYDRKVKVVLSADAEPERLYCGERLAFEFKRTVSRLREMQTHAYLDSVHRG